jgi:predicted PurR-regulated permease PerM
VFGILFASLYDVIQFFIFKEKNMRFIFSKISLVFISFVLIAVLLWIGGGNLSSNSASFYKQTDGYSSGVVIDNVKGFISSFTKWVFETSKPLASDLGASVQTWWEAEKIVIVDQLIKWLSQQQSNISAALLTQLREMTSNTAGRH